MRLPKMYRVSTQLRSGEWVYVAYYMNLPSEEREIEPDDIVIEAAWHHIVDYGEELLSPEDEALVKHRIVEMWMEKGQVDVYY